HRTGCRTGQRLECGVNVDSHAAIQVRAPDVRSLLEYVECLLSFGCPRIAADRRCRCRIVESCSGGIQVVDYDVRARKSLGCEKRNEGDQQKRFLHYWI